MDPCKISKFACSDVGFEGYILDSGNIYITFGVSQIRLVVKLDFGQITDEFNSSDKSDI